MEIVAKQKVKATKTKAPKKDSRIEDIYEQEVTFTCPKRGKITQIVKIKRCKPAVINDGKYVLQSNNSIDRLEEQDDGLSIYSDGEELGITGEEVSE